jgi:hypothetical protein
LTEEILMMAPAFFHHVGDHLLGHVEHGVEVGFDHHVPVFPAHFQEHTITRDTRVIHQHVDHTVLGLGLGEGFHGGIPITHIAHRCEKGVAQSSLLCDPLHMITRRAATGDNFKTFFV